MRQIILISLLLWGMGAAGVYAEDQAETVSEPVVDVQEAVTPEAILEEEDESLLLEEEDFSDEAVEAVETQESGEAATQSPDAIDEEEARVAAESDDAVAEEQAMGSGRPFSFTLGFFNGGGSLVGVDFQTLVGLSNLGVQVGAGYLGYDVAVNWYFEPNMESEYISLTYWNQGLTDRYARYLGVTYGFKAFGWLNGQLGLAYALAMSDAVQESFADAGTEVPKGLVLYSLGVYF